MHLSRLFLVYGFAAVALTALTLWHFEYANWFAPTSQNLLPQLQEWQHPGVNAQSKMTLINEDSEASVSAEYELQLPAERDDNLQIRMRVSSDSIVPSGKPGQTSRVLIWSKTPESGKPSHYKTMFSLSGNNRDLNLVGLYALAEKVNSVVIRVELARATGTLTVHEIEAFTAGKTTFSTILPYFIVLLWIGLLAAVLRQSFTGRLPFRLGVIVIMATGLILLPQQFRVQLQQQLSDVASPVVADFKPAFSSALKSASNASGIPDTLPSSWQPFLQWFNAEHQAHAAFFFVCTLLLLVWLPLIQTAIAMVIYAATTEVLQHFSPGRTADLMDFYANASGEAVALLFYLGFVVLRKALRKALRGTLLTDSNT